MCIIVLLWGLWFNVYWIIAFSEKLDWDLNPGLLKTYKDNQSAIIDWTKRNQVKLLNLVFIIRIQYDLYELIHNW